MEKTAGRGRERTTASPHVKGEIGTKKIVRVEVNHPVCACKGQNLDGHTVRCVFGDGGVVHLGGRCSDEDIEKPCLNSSDTGGHDPREKAVVATKVDKNEGDKATESPQMAEVER